MTCEYNQTTAFHTWFTSVPNSFSGKITNGTNRPSRTSSVCSRHVVITKILVGEAWVGIQSGKTFCAFFLRILYCGLQICLQLSSNNGDKWLSNGTICLLIGQFSRYFFFLTRSQGVPQTQGTRPVFLFAINKNMEWGGTPDSVRKHDFYGNLQETKRGKL